MWSSSAVSVPRDQHTVRVLVRSLSRAIGRRVMAATSRRARASWRDGPRWPWSAALAWMISMFALVRPDAPCHEDTYAPRRLLQSGSSAGTTPSTNSQ